MTQESAQAFVERAKEDKAFEMAIWRYVLSRDVGTLVAFGEAQGYTFTAGEIRDAIPQDWQPLRRQQLQPSTVSNGPARSFDYRAKILWLGGIVTLVMALGSLYFTRDFAHSYFRFVELRDHGVITKGQVDDRWTVGVPCSGISLYTKYYIHFRFTVDGRDYTFHQRVSEDTYGSYPFYPEAQIRYNPDDPQQAVLKGTNAPDMLVFGEAVILGLAGAWVAARTWTVSRRQMGMSVQVLE